MKKLIGIFAVLLLLSNGQQLFAQEVHKAPAGSDGIPVFWLDPILVSAKAGSPEARKKYMEQVQAYERLRRYVRKLLPMAREAAALIERVDRDMAGVTDKRTRRRYIKELEEELFERYEDDIRTMSKTQGIILVKLIYRETDNSAFRLIKEYRSGSTASFWQVISRLYGIDLKEQYDPRRNQAIEMCIQQIDNNVPDTYTVTVYR